MMRILLLVLTVALLLFGAPSEAVWRSATEAELKDVIPARAPVGSERIETEFRTASGITNGNGKYIAGVVLITAGYWADGKYSHFLWCRRQNEGTIQLKPGDYVLAGITRRMRCAFCFMKRRAANFWVVWTRRGTAPSGESNPFICIRQARRQ